MNRYKLFFVDPKDPTKYLPKPRLTTIIPKVGDAKAIGKVQYTIESITTMEATKKPANTEYLEIRLKPKPYPRIRFVR